MNTPTTPKETTKHKGKRVKLSKCCNAKIDYRGGGYEGEYICPIEDYCSECNQTLAVNGQRVKIYNPKTGKMI